MNGALIKNVITRLAVFGLVVLLSACGNGKKTGPEDIRWDQDACHLCQMLISDARFATEVRGGKDHKLYKFDDVGCAINWLNQQAWAADPSVEIWVASVTSTRKKMIWLDARQARFVKGELTPMDYGYSAFAPMSNASGEVTGIGFVELTHKIIENGDNHICKALK